MNTALEIRNLSYGYRSNWSMRRVPSLFEVNLNVIPGEFFGFLGHSGAGKTTTIKCILSLLKPTKGHTKIFGKDSSKTDARAEVGYVPEQPYFYDHLSVQETISMFASLSGIAKQNLRNSVNSTLEKLKISDRANEPLKSLSKGLIQRVALAQALVAKPKLLILDEPFSGLDPLGRKEIADLLFELKKEGITVFMSSHILNDVEAICDRVSIMRKGKLQGVFEVKNIPKSLNSGSYELVLRDIKENLPDFTKESLKDSFKGGLLHLQYSSREKAEEMLKKALELKLAVEKFSYIRPSLEDLFIELVKDTGDK